MIPWRIVAGIAAKDLRIERRSRTGLLTALLFALMVQLIVVFAHDGGSLPLHVYAPSVLWITVALASLLTLNRAFHLERTHAALDAILLAPVPRAALFWGKWLANVAFVALVIVVALPVWLIWFDVTPVPGLLLLLPVALCTVAGMTAVGTVFSAMAVRTRVGEMLLPVMLLPFFIPPVYFASQATLQLLIERPFAAAALEAWRWVRLLLLFDIAFLTMAHMLFPAVVDE